MLVRFSHLENYMKKIKKKLKLKELSVRLHVKNDNMVNY